MPIAPRGRSMQIRSQAQGVAMSADRMQRSTWALPRVLACAALAIFAVAAHAQDTKKQVDDLMRQGQQQMSKGHPRDAIKTLGKAIELDPTRSELYMLRSRARDSSGSFDQALEDASKYISLEPSDEYGYLILAGIFLSLEKPERALEDANKAISLKPKEPDGYFRRAD